MLEKKQKAKLAFLLKNGKPIESVMSKERNEQLLHPGTDIIDY